MKYKIGIIQGRLTTAPPGRLQYFPKKYDLEFILAKKIRFNHIEMFSERKFNSENPIWNKEGIKILKKNNGLIYSFVDDFILKKNINKKMYQYYKKLIYQLKKLNIKLLTIPFYGNNKITYNNYLNYVDFINFLSVNCSKNKICLCIESNISPDLFFLLKKKINNNFYFTFDTGNRILLKRNLIEDLLKFKNVVKHIHIKDKNKNKKNVQLGKGLVKFKFFFQALKKIKYKGRLTLETTRGKHPKNMAKKNLLFLKKLIY